MKVSEFDFDLPADRIAQHPIRPRDAARMLLVRDDVEDSCIANLPDLLSPGDIIVFNDTRVIPARLTGRRGAARVELTLHMQMVPDTWRAFARPARRLRVDDYIEFAPDFSATMTEKGEGGEVTVQFNRSGADLIAALERHGVMPLPPYIKRDPGGASDDRDDYQTIFAARDGAVAAPTAGLHFTPALLAALKSNGVECVTLTLHVGAGTFLPIKVDDTADHKMHVEWGEIKAEAAAAINAARAAGGKVLAVGTTALRLLESAAEDTGQVGPFSGETSLFITPGYRFRVCDRLLTNFHLPRSTLFMLVCAFAGTDRMKAAYRHAVDNEYRFYSYGDCCLLERDVSK